MYWLLPITASADTPILELIGIFFGVGLTVSLLIASYGLDLSPGFL